MIFNTIDFLIFFTVVLMVYFVLPARIRYIWLLVASYYFYMCWNPVYSLLIAFITIVTYMCGRILECIKNKSFMKLVMIGCLIIDIGLLVYFKYTNFLIGTINKVLISFQLDVLHEVDILLPVGISFYTFQAMGYVIDVYRGEVKAERNLLKYALFVSFFPQLVAGPIERSKNLLAQIHEETQHKLWNYQRVTSGLTTMLWGFFLKVVIADRVAVLADYIFENYDQYGTVILAIGAIAFAIQIYCDFGGYSTIAIGAAKVLGFELMENFDTPYFSQGIVEFWRRWHISLSIWFRDYIYIPLGGNRNGKWEKYRNVLITFSVSGLWHGANWTYVFWGFLHGFIRLLKELSPLIHAVCKLTHAKVDSFGYKLGKVLITFSLVDIAWIFFRAETLRDALRYIYRMVFVHDWWHLFDQTIYGLGLNMIQIHILVVALLMLLVVDVLKYRKKKIFEYIME